MAAKKRYRIPDVDKNSKTKGKRKRKDKRLYFARDRVGAPRIFESPEEMEKVIEAYFLSCQNGRGRWVEPPTLSGLALALGVSRQTIGNYGKEYGPELAEVVARAKRVCGRYAHARLYGGGQVAGAIFDLKVNYGETVPDDWIERTILEHAGSVELVEREAANEAYKQRMSELAKAH